MAKAKAEEARGKRVLALNVTTAHTYGDHNLAIVEVLRPSTRNPDVMLKVIDIHGNVEWLRFRAHEKVPVGTVAVEAQL